MTRTTNEHIIHYLFVTLMILVIPQELKAQTCIHQIGVVVNGTHLTGGDVYPTVGMSVEGTYTRNMTHRWAWYVGASYVKYSGNDKLSSAQAVKRRGLKYETEFIETSAGVEMTFKSYAFEYKKAFAPYLGFGFGLAVKSNQKPKNGQWTSAREAFDLNTSTTELAMVPLLNVSLGIKSKVSRRVGLSFNVRAIYYFSDNIDFSAPKDKYFDTSVGAQNKIIGSSGNDWAVRIGVKIDYLFGVNDCYCQ